MNKCTFYGLIASDLNIRKNRNSNGEEFLSLFFSLSIKEKNRYSYIPCVAYNKVAEIISNYCERNDSIIVEGRLNQYETTQGSEVVVRFNIKVSNVYLLDNRLKTDNIIDEDEELMLVEKTSYSQDIYEIEDEDIPF